LEVAPFETELPSARWGNIKVNGDRPEVGSGKRNTEIILDQLKKAWGNGKGHPLGICL